MGYRRCVNVVFYTKINKPTLNARTRVVFDVPIIHLSKIIQED